jgi:crotonobetainyl-CoA:carnitine CoA-transferase CaiB-like acyl-CoA transferase
MSDAGTLSRVDAPGAAPSQSRASLPLAGIRVVDLGNYIAGPGAAMILGDLGADVIKIEPKTGDVARSIGTFGSAMIRSYNRDKRSIAIDLRQPRGVDIVRRLLARSDVLVQNMRPGLVEELGIGPAAMRALNPRLIYMSVSGFGMNGPSRQRPGLDIAAQAESGIMSVTGEPDRPPQKVGFPIIDSATTHVAAQAVLAALFRRERTGEGSTLETSLLEVAVHLQTPAWHEYAETGREPTRRGSGQVTNAPAAEQIETRDGMIVLSAYTQDHWKRLCTTIHREDLISDSRFATNADRVANKPAMLIELSKALAHFSTEDCVALLSRNQIVAAAVRKYSQVREAADVQASGIFTRTLDGADGSYETLGLPYRFVGSERPATRGAPQLGAHTAEVLRDLGFSTDELRDLLQEDVVVSNSQSDQRDV